MTWKNGDLISNVSVNFYTDNVCPLNSIWNKQLSITGNHQNSDNNRINKQVLRLTYSRHIVELTPLAYLCMQKNIVFRFQTYWTVFLPPFIHPYYDGQFSYFISHKCFEHYQRHDQRKVVFVVRATTSNYFCYQSVAN
jgi:hypothetical protein